MILIQKILQKIFGTTNDRLLKSYTAIVKQINDLEPEISKIKDSEFHFYTAKLKKRYQEEQNLDALLPEAFALVREAGKRVRGLRHFDVQLIGGIVMHNGMIAEMGTGEGKTLAATLPAYLNALTGRGVHIVTVNDYLAKRDAEWMGSIYEKLGLSVGYIIHNISDLERRNAYNCDITYCTNNELGFDYLRDNMRYQINDMVQRPFHYAIVDEVDSILIDEARTPLIISGAVDESTDLYYKIDKLIPMLKKEDYELEEKTRTVFLTEKGNDHVEELLIAKGLLSSENELYSVENISLVHHVSQALKAHKLFTKDKDYMIKDKNLLIIDEFTGRALEGRRFSEGLHQALEAKESLVVRNENQTLASITFQNYFRLYPKLAGMTGTAMTEAQEFQDIYNLGVVNIPTNVLVKRIDEDDAIYATLKEKDNAIVNEVELAYKNGQPVLVGTVSIEKSEHFSHMLKKLKVKHNVLNAKFHEKEAFIIAQAGRSKAVTIATNMAGRGTDIMLGGNPEMLLADEITDKEVTGAKYEKLKKDIYKKVSEDKEKVKELGGILVIGTERHESRRIDNQLRGRSGRQGDPGRTKFFLSLQDDLMRIFASDKISPILQKLGLKDGEAVTHPWINRTLEKAQQKVEMRNFDIRKNLLKFDDVMNDQRKVIYEQRREIMQGDDYTDTISDMILSVIEELVEEHIPRDTYLEQWDLVNLDKKILHFFDLNLDVEKFAQKEGVAQEDIFEFIKDACINKYQALQKKHSADVVARAERHFLLLTLDQLWKEHLHSLDHLRQGINLRAYGQKDPLNEYKKEAFLLFDGMLSNLRKVVVGRLFHVVIEVTTEKPHKKAPMQETRTDPALLNHSTTDAKLGRNDLCHCGSGLKYKHCHGKL